VISIGNPFRHKLCAICLTRKPGRFQADAFSLELLAFTDRRILLQKLKKLMTTARDREKIVKPRDGSDV
jgi:hypothetical protein